MAPESVAITETGVAALLFAAIFLLGRHMPRYRLLNRDPRNLVSFGAGMSAAYVFVHLMPELQGARHRLVESVDAPLRREHGVAYDRHGRFVLAAMSLLGWAAAQLFALPPFVLALLVAFISGAIIMNSLIMELPSEKDGRFLPFLAGGILYGLILLPLG